jgi:hypothetical protein
MATASQNNLSLVLQQQDVNGVNILNRQIGVVGYSGAVGQFSDAILTGTGATNIPFPIGLTNALQFYVKNTSATGNITINATPLSATGSVIVAKLAPGALSIPLWSPLSGASGGYSAITGTADLPNCTLEFFIGG